MGRFLLVLAVVLALAGAAVWFTTHTGSARGLRSAEASLPDTEAEPGVHALAPAPAATSEVERGSREHPFSPPAPVATQPSRRVPASIKDAELARARWIEGRVLFPAGTPEDEEVFVTADGRDFEDGSDQRVKVARDGTFRVAFSEKTRTGHFELEARYLYLDRVMYWKRAASNDALVLEPKLGARIAGRVRVPAGRDASQVGGQVWLEVSRRAGNSFDHERQGYHELSKGLDFAFDALAPGVDPERCYAVIYDGEAFLGRSRRLVPEAGKTLTVELDLRPGLTLAGIVRDEIGAPLAGASLDASVQSSSGSPTSSSWPHGTSGADGSFHIGALACGKVQLRARLAGYVPLERELGRLEEGQDVQDLVLVLTRGSSIAGTVRWPDGSPAEAYLVLTPHRTSVGWEWNSDQNKAGKSDASGAFAISGLAQKTYRVTARAKKTEEVLVKSTATGKERPKEQTTQWSAEIDLVQAGAQDLVLTLSNGLALAGRVVDDLGAPLEDFGVKADLVEPGPNSRRDAHLSSLFRDTDGSFRMSGFAPGEWKISCWSNDHAGSEPVSVTLPGNDPVVLVAPREAIVGGQVLDPAGAPVIGASVRVSHAEPRESYATALPNRLDETNVLGTFRIYRLGPGVVTLQASGAGWVPSAPESLELTAGETRSDIVLRLRSGGTIEGELIGADGRPQSGPTVWVGGQDHIFSGVVTDADGRFWVTGVAPGDVDLRVETLEGIQLEQRVSVTACETVHVRLAAPRGLVRLHGLVHAGGEPLAGARVDATRPDEEGRSFGGASSSSKTGEDGAYELHLPGAGRYGLSIQGDYRRSFSWRTTVDAPAVEALQFDVSIPLGRISGRVTDAQGQVLAGVVVRSEPEQHEGDAHGFASAFTDAQGRFELFVPAGAHSVRAGGASGSLWETGLPYAESRVGNLVVGENAHLRGVDLRLESGGVLEGVVRRPGGFDAFETWIWVQGDAGEQLAGIDGDGRFQMRLAAGSYLVSALSGDDSACEPETVEIVSGQAQRIELVLLPARLVLLTIRKDGAPVGCDLQVIDERGTRQRVQGGENGTACLGPLLPARYTVRGERDGKVVERVFEVRLEEKEPKVEIVFE